MEGGILVVLVFGVFINEKSDHSYLENSEENWLKYFTDLFNSINEVAKKELFEISFSS
jgi:hypothetical protein